MIADLGSEDATAPARALEQAEQAQTGNQKGETGRLRDGRDWLNFRITGKENNRAVPQGISKGVARIKTGIERITAEAAAQAQPVTGLPAGARAARKASATAATADEGAATAATAETPVSVVSKIGAALPSRCAVDKRAAAEATGEAVAPVTAASAAVPAIAREAATAATAARQVSGVSAAATASTTQLGDSAGITAIKSGHSAASAPTRDYQRRVVWSNHK
jgi:hypothetical protein